MIEEDKDRNTAGHYTSDTLGDELCWDGGAGVQFVSLPGVVRGISAVVIGGPRIHDDPHYVLAFRQNLFELRNLLRTNIPVTYDEDILGHCGPGNLRWAAFSMELDPDYAWGKYCGWAEPHYIHRPDLDGVFVPDLPTFIWDWDTRVSTDPGCEFVRAGTGIPVPRWVEFLDTAYEETMGGPPIGGGQLQKSSSRIIRGENPGKEEKG